MERRETIRVPFLVTLGILFLWIMNVEAAWLSGYSYRKMITITGQPGAGTGYQVLLKVGESSGSSGADFHIENHAENFPNDIRFTDNDETTELAHWLEKTEGSSPNRTVYFWVKVNDNLDSDQNIYIYYGNSSASSASDGEATFLFFDDFNSGFNSSKWDRSDASDVYISDGVMQLHQNVTDKSTWLKSKIDLPNKLTVESVKKVHSGNHYYTGYFAIYNSEFSTLFTGVRYDYYCYGSSCDRQNDNSFYPFPCSVGVKLSPFWDSIWFRESLKYNGDNGSIRFVRNKGEGDEAINHSGDTHSGSMRLKFCPYGWWTGHYLYIDWIAVGKYTSPEPSFSSVGSEQTPIFPPTVTNSTGASNITSSSARLNGEITDAGGEAPTTHIYWGTSDGGTNPSNWAHDVNLGAQPEGTFYTDISGLDPNTTYYYRCYASNSAGDDWADETASFTTLVAIPTVTTGEATDITTHSAVGHGNITADGGASITQHGVCWSTSPDPTTADSHTEEGAGSIGAFTSNITGLDPNITYHYRAYATNSAGTGYGEDMTFTTLPVEIVVDWNNGNVQKITLQGNVKFTFINGQPGGVYRLIIIQDSVGGRTVSWQSDVKWQDAPPVLSTAPGAVDIAEFIYDGFNYFGTINLGFND